MKKVFLIIGIFAVILCIATVFAVLNADELGATPEGKIANDLGISTEEAKKVLEVFKQVGIEDYSSLKHDELLDEAHKKGEKGYRLSTRDVNNVIIYLNSDNTLNQIRYADNNLYSKGKVKGKITDYTVTLNEASNIQYQVEEAIKTVLKSPSTAKFPSIKEWNFGKQNGVIIVQSYVDAQNSFGAMMRSEFQVKIKNNNIISLILDGKEYIKQ